MSVPLDFRIAAIEDAELLAPMNRQLIVDEGHRNKMTVPELAQRMSGFLAGEYQAVIFERAGQTIGYALFRREADHVYLRQFYVAANHRRGGVGRAAIDWLRRNVWSPGCRVRLDVLVGNSLGISFWRAIGFKDYCVAMELDPVVDLPQ